MYFFSQGTLLETKPVNTSLAKEQHSSALSLHDIFVSQTLYNSFSFLQSLQDFFLNLPLPPPQKSNGLPLLNIFANALLICNDVYGYKFAIGPRVRKYP